MSAAPEFASAAPADVVQPSLVSASGVAVAAVAAMLASAIVLASYLLFFAPTPLRFATVDLTDVVAVREMQAMLDAAKSGGDPQTTLRAATLWPQELERTLAAVQGECQCILLVRAAVVGQHLTDFTPELKKRLGLDQLDAAELRRSLSASLFASPRASQTAGGAPPVAPLLPQPPPTPPAPQAPIR